jgi:hypothetical protein
LRIRIGKSRDRAAAAKTNSSGRGGRSLGFAVISRCREIGTWFWEPGIQPKGHWTISCNLECSFFSQNFCRFFDKVFL